MKRAQIVDSTIVNVIEVDPENVPAWAEDWPEVTDAGIGWTVDVNGDFHAPQPVPPVPPAEADVRAEGARRLEVIAATYSRAERETWHKQIAEAKAYDADAGASVPFLSAMAGQSGETVAEIVTRILANDAAFTAAAGAVLGAQRAILAMDPIPADYADDSRWP